MSVCLQGMVDELLSKGRGERAGEKNARISRRGSWNYMKRDGSSHQISSIVGRSISTDGIVQCANVSIFITLFSSIFLLTLDQYDFFF